MLRSFFKIGSKNGDNFHDFEEYLRFCVENFPNYEGHVMLHVIHTIVICLIGFHAVENFYFIAKRRRNVFVLVE